MNTSVPKPLPPLAIAPIADADIPAVVALWQACGLTRPWNDPASDIALARRGPNSTVLIGRDGGAIVATAMVGHDGHRGWVYYLSADPALRRQGIGKALMDAAEAWLKARGVPKIQLMVRETNISVLGFYQRIGYEPNPVKLVQKWLRSERKEAEEK